MVTVSLLVAGWSLVGLIAVADAHGAATRPGSRTYLCRVDGTHNSGDIQPSNPACAEAVAIGGKQPLWDWFGVLRGDGAGRTRGFIPDGQLCSGGDPKYAGYDLARADWPYTSLTGGAELTVRYNAWAHHPGQFRLYITKDGYDPTKPLAWDDLEAEPFSVYDQTTPNGNDEANNTPDYQWPVTLPQKSGTHIIYSVWERSDSQETFYGCSDIRFDGGSGEVFGVGPGATVVGAPSGATTATTTAPTPAASTGDGAIPPAGEMTDGEMTDGGMSDGGMPADGSGPNAAAMTDPATGEAIPTDGSAAVGIDGAIDPQASPTGEPAATADANAALASAAATTGGGDTPLPVAADGAEPATVTAAGATGGGLGWPAALAIGAIGVALGTATTIAVQASRRNRELEDRLARYDRTRPQPDWDRLADDGGDTGELDLQLPAPSGAPPGS
ncbi:MAG: lytic polysaccharide monooxygenase [Actinomycetota bacterium]